MGSFLKQYFSHPGKYLYQHSSNVVRIMSEHGASDLGIVSGIFHDIGKMNPHGQKRILHNVTQNNVTQKYWHHSYLSILTMLSMFLDNEHLFKKEIGISDDEDVLQSIQYIAALIANHHKSRISLSFVDRIGHHQNLLEDFFVECDSGGIYLDMTKYVRQSWPRFRMYKKNIKAEASSTPMATEFDPSLLNFLGEPLPNRTNPYKTFFDFRFDFAVQTFADQADASGYNWQASDVEEIKLRNDSPKKFHAFIRKRMKEWETKEGNKQFNDLRTKIRKATVKNLKQAVKEHPEQRVFSVCAATGSGKTITLIESYIALLKACPHLTGLIFGLPYLAISEQVSDDMEEIFGQDSVWRIDSKTDNSETKSEAFYITECEQEEEKEQKKKTIQIDFAEKTFDRPIIITSFVRIFEALTSNKKDDILKLSHFRNKVIVIDEIQSLPVRTYGSFSVLLNVMCERLNCYVIIASATMPNFSLPLSVDTSIFPASYQPPYPIAPSYAIDHPLFDRYDIQFHFDEPHWMIEQLGQNIIKELMSVLCILNTVTDTKLLAQWILSHDHSFDHVEVLSTKLEPDARTRKIQEAKDRMSRGERVLLISTQLIRAGVDVDFPIAYLDIARFFDIHQGAGRCGRNSMFRGMVHVFILRDEKKNMAKYKYIYRDTGVERDGELVEWLPNYLKDEAKRYVFSEKELIKIQRLFFDHILENTKFGMKDGVNYHEAICELDIDKVGKFALIADEQWGKSISVYLPPNNGKPDLFNELKRISNEMADGQHDPYEKVKYRIVEFNKTLKKMSHNMVRVVIPHKNFKSFVDSVANRNKVSNEYFRFNRNTYYDEMFGLMLPE